MKLDEQQTGNMLKVATQRPPERKHYIEASIREQGRLLDDPTLKAFGIQVDPNMRAVPARILQQPSLSYASPECMDVGTQGAWNLKTTKVPRGTHLESWTVVCLVAQSEIDIPGPSGLRPFFADLIRMLRDIGVECQAQMPPMIFEDRSLSVHQHLEKGIELASQHYGKPCQLLMVVFRVRSAALYKEVKLCTDGLLGVPSQCLTMKAAGLGYNNMPKGRLQFCANLALKINAKGGGLNVRLAGEPQQVIPLIGARPFMVFGIDVYHPSAADASEPSVAAVVGSLDKYLGRYSARVMPQGHRTPLVADLKQAVRELLVDFYRYNNQAKPEALLFYRDGVSESLFSKVLQQEYVAIRQACFELEQGYCPPITFVVLHKRHNVRLFPTDPVNMDRSGNVLPGTVIDRDICAVADFDFYLNSHAGIQGTSKPAHYHVLVDENGFSADGIQLLTYWLCYLYCRCTRSVSYCPPAYYAHLAAFRGKLMLHSREPAAEPSPVEALEKESQEGSARMQPEPSIKLQFMPIHNNLAGTMYFV